jgi:hypothetical protein
MPPCGFYRNLFAYRYDHDSPFDSPWARSAGCQERALQFNRQRLFDQFSPAHRHGPHKYVVGGRQQPLDPCTGWEPLADLAILLRFSPSPFGRSLSYLCVGEPVYARTGSEVASSCRTPWPLTVTLLSQGQSRVLAQETTTKPKPQQRPRSLNLSLVDRPDRVLLDRCLSTTTRRNRCADT